MTENFKWRKQERTGLFSIINYASWQEKKYKGYTGSGQLKMKKFWDFLSHCNESDLRGPSTRSHSNRRQRAEEVCWGLSFDLSPFQIKSQLKVSAYSEGTILHSSRHISIPTKHSKYNSVDRLQRKRHK